MLIDLLIQHNSSKNPSRPFLNGQADSKIHMEVQKTLAKTTWKSCRANYLIFRYYKTTVIKEMWYQHQDRQIGQWNKIVRKNWHTWIIFFLQSYIVWWRKDSFSTNVARTIGYPYAKKKLWLIAWLHI